jgi:hypothetical protein
MQTNEFLRSLPITVAPEFPMLLLPKSLHCLSTSKVVRFFRLLEIAVAAESPIWL